MLLGALYGQQDCRRQYGSAHAKLFAESGCEFASDILKIPQQRGGVLAVSPCNARSYHE